MGTDFSLLALVFSIFMIKHVNVIMEFWIYFCHSEVMVLQTV